MNYRKEIKIIFWISVGLLFLSIILKNSMVFGVCFSYDSICADWTMAYIGYPMFFWMLFLIPSVWFSYFFKEKIYKIWRTFFFIYIPVSIIWIVNTPLNCFGGGWIKFLCYGKYDISHFTAILFLIITTFFGIYSLISKKTENGK